MSPVSFNSHLGNSRLQSKTLETAKLAAELSRAEKDVLAQQNQLVSDGDKLLTSVQYTYTTGPDGKKYITGAIVKTKNMPENPKTALGDIPKVPSQNDLTPAEQEQVRLLEEVDGEVRAHENAHQAAAGAYASAPVFEYEIGPDGKKYAVAGKVRVSMPSTSDPELAAEYAKRLYAAAVAPAGGLSAQDIAVAHKAISKAQNIESPSSQKSGASQTNPADKYSYIRNLSHTQQGFLDVMAIDQTSIKNDHRSTFDRFL